jgi:hypothetical protein
MVISECQVEALAGVANIGTARNDTTHKTLSVLTTESSEGLRSLANERRQEYGDLKC